MNATKITKMLMFRCNISKVWPVIHPALTQRAYSCTSTSHCNYRCKC